MALRAVGLQGQTLDRALQVDGQRHAHAHGKHTGLFEHLSLHVGHIACGKNLGVGD